ncbi:DNA repair protein RadC [Legionella wadsworthii]|uniref:DNA repair protein RadC n=1 Tax=Legionella wadsworthii TaxID=28088 RepID=A0A378LQT4_9GAMM|nr:DNA repair protein RadC [Legionella wadsworthii]STY28208.1 DNA repair protein RadC [Legionella wadsworthii]
MTVVATRQLGLREKLITYGAQTLSDTELLAVFISFGNHKKSCMHLAFDLLVHFGDLRAVLYADKEQFKQVQGLGEVRYAQLQAVKEMCRRSDLIHLQKEVQINNSQQTYAYLKKCLRDRKNEIFAALFLDNQNRVIAYEELFSGTINTATIHPRPIIERVLQLNAAALILAHNHPSGICDASDQDILVTERIRNALELVDTRLLDHIIIGDNEFYSIIAENKLNVSCDLHS